MQAYFPYLTEMVGHEDGCICRAALCEIYNDYWYDWLCLVFIGSEVLYAAY